MALLPALQVRRIAADDAMSRRVIPNNAGRLMPSNTSQLPGIRFGIEAGVQRVYVAYGDGRTSYSVQANGVRGAFELAFERRREAGLPVPTMAAALRAFREWALVRA